MKDAQCGWVQFGSQKLPDRCPMWTAWAIMRHSSNEYPCGRLWSLSRLYLFPKNYWNTTLYCYYIPSRNWNNYILPIAWIRLPPNNQLTLSWLRSTWQIVRERVSPRKLSDMPLRYKLLLSHQLISYWSNMTLHKHDDTNNFQIFDISSHKITMWTAKLWVWWSFRGHFFRYRSRKNAKIQNGDFSYQLLVALDLKYLPWIYAFDGDRFS